MILKKSSKEIIDYESKMIQEIEKQIMKYPEHSAETRRLQAIAIYLKRRDDLELIYEDND